MVPVFLNVLLEPVFLRVRHHVGLTTRQQARSPPIAVLLLSLGRLVLYLWKLSPGGRSITGSLGDSDFGERERRAAEWVKVRMAQARLSV